MVVESPTAVNHEVIADHALLLSEAADVLLDMAMSPRSRADDLEDIESIQAEAASFPTRAGLPELIDAMFADVVALGRGLAAQSDPLPPSMDGGSGMPCGGADSEHPVRSPGSRTRLSPHHIHQPLRRRPASRRSARCGSGIGHPQRGGCDPGDASALVPGALKVGRSHDRSGTP